MAKLQTIKFKNFITLQRGFDLPKKDMIEGLYPVVGSTSILGYHNQYKVNPPGVVTGRSGSLGKVQFINEKYWPHNTALWVKDFKGNYSDYVYYYLQTINLDKFNSGTGVPTLNRNDLDNLEIKVHKIVAQKTIATVLSAYDDLIENNNRRIKILEKIAQTLYNEWFVKFRFPGHEKVKMVNSELGKIPVKWEIKNIFDICNIRYGKTLPTTKMKKDGEYLVYGAAKVIGKYDEYNYENPMVITGCRGSVGQIKITKPKSFVTNNSFIFDINEEQKLFLYHSLLNIGLYNYIGGTAQPQITLEGISALKLVIPEQDLISEFNKIVVPIFKQINLLDDKNNNLIETRDILLPKLISGKLNVSDLDIKTEDTE
ncbi:MAG: restriction endonuclease subunit S [Elusimicrobiota bacterium]